jgi:hypothetical protein
MTSSQRRNETRERNATQRHAELIDHGWRSRVDGKWRSPDPDDHRAWTTPQPGTSTNAASTRKRGAEMNDPVFPNGAR